MSMLRRATRADIGAEGGARVVTVACSTETLGRDDIVVVSGGIDLTAYRNNPVVLWQHNPDWPVARATEIGVIEGKLVAKVEFPDEGVSSHADTVYGLIKAGIVNAASTGFETRQAEPLDPTKPREGMRITACELQEFSFVSIPAVPDALITERALQEARTRMSQPEEADPRIAVMKTRMIKRGLYEVGRLAFLLDDLGWTKSSAEWEAEIEQDGSTVPAQLGEALQALGSCLIEMTKEEVAELCGGVDVEVDPVEVDIVEQSASPAIKRFRIGMFRARPPSKPVPVAVTAVAPAARGMAFHRRMAALYERGLERH